MAKYTEYYSLEKPDGSDKAQISTLNKNFDKIDEEMKANRDAAENAKKAADAKQDPISVDGEETEYSENPLQSGAAYKTKKNIEKKINEEIKRAQEEEKKIHEAILSETEKLKEKDQSIETAVNEERQRAEESERNISAALSALGLKVKNGMICATINV